MKLPFITWVVKVSSHEICLVSSVVDQVFRSESQPVQSRWGVILTSLAGVQAVAKLHKGRNSPQR